MVWLFSYCKNYVKLLNINAKVEVKFVLSHAPAINMDGNWI